MRTCLSWLVVLGACGKVPLATDGAVDDSNTITPDASPCQELASECASANVLRACTTVGQPPVDTTCHLGCSQDNGAHCRAVQPGFHLLPADLQPTTGLAEITMSGSTTINASDGSITNLRTAGTGLIAGIEFTVRNGVGVFRFQKLTITGGTPAQSMMFTGTNAVALVAITSIEASGTILNVQGSCTANTPGPGGIAGGFGGIGGNDTQNAVNGGAAAGTKGGKGGTSSNTESDYICGGGGGGAHAGNGGGGAPGGTLAGGAGGQLDTVNTFVGGSGGGGGGGPWDQGIGHSGGGGGGAIHLAANLLVKINGGGIQAGGCGGNGAFGGCPGGGGAGGMIVLEASDVEISNATLAANGGGGGGYSRGQHGALVASSAAGGTASPNYGAGAGGSSSTMISGLTASTSSVSYGGAGGGGGGRIVLRSGDGLLTTGNAVFSPAATMNGTVAIN